MADNKKYYYVKLKDNFFDRAEIKILESVDNGIIYSNLYLKLCLLSLRGEGKIMFMDNVPYDENMISSATGVELDHVRCGMVELNRFGLIEKIEGGAIWITHIQGMIGKSSTEAERKADYRQRIEKRDNVPILSTRDKRLEIRDKRLNKYIKTKFADYVSFTPDEYNKLINQFGEHGTMERIENINLYKGSTGKKYASDYLTILNWERKNNKSTIPQRKESKDYVM